MKVAVFNVGGALSAYVEFVGKKVVIDLGKGNGFSPVNDFLIPLFERRKNAKTGEKFIIDQLIVSHPHGDHINDLEDFDKSFYVGLYTTPNDLSPENNSVKNVNWDFVDNPDSDEVKKVRNMYYGRRLPLQVCDGRMTIGYINPGVVENDHTLVDESYTNNISIGVLIRSGYSILFPGDVQKEGMKVFLEKNPAIKKQIHQGVDFLVTPHHGLKSSFSTDLFAAMNSGKTTRLNIVSEKVTHGPEDKRQVDSRYSTSDYCMGKNNLSTKDSPVYQRKTSNGHIFIDDDGTVTIDNDIENIIKKF